MSTMDISRLGTLLDGHLIEWHYSPMQDSMPKAAHTMMFDQRYIACQQLGDTLDKHLDLPPDVAFMVAEYLVCPTGIRLGEKLTQANLDNMDFVRHDDSGYHHSRLAHNTHALCGHRLPAPIGALDHLH